MLKCYYTIQEAAEYLSAKSNEPISIADVLEFVGDDRLSVCASYSGEVCSFWNTFFGAEDLWAEEQPIFVRGYFCVNDSYESHITRTSTSFSLDAKKPVEVKSFSSEGEDQLELYLKAIVKMASNQPTNEKIRRQAKVKGIELDTIDSQYYETTVSFGGFFSGSGYPEVFPAIVGLNECLIRKVDLDALLELSNYDPQNLLFKYTFDFKNLNLKDLPKTDVCKSDASSLQETVPQREIERRGVGLHDLKLHSWPISIGRTDTILNALNNSLRWVSGAIVGKRPIFVNPATLAFVIQDATKDKRVQVWGNAKVLGRHLALHFPEFLGEYNEMIEFGN